MVRATLARFSLREVSLLLTTALLLMICGLVASDSALSRAAHQNPGQQNHQQERGNVEDRPCQLTALEYGIG